MSAIIDWILRSLVLHFTQKENNHFCVLCCITSGYMIVVLSFLRYITANKRNPGDLPIMLEGNKGRIDLRFEKSSPVWLSRQAGGWVFRGLTSLALQWMASSCSSTQSQSLQKPRLPAPSRARSSLLSPTTGSLCAWSYSALRDYTSGFSIIAPPPETQIP